MNVFRQIYAVAAILILFAVGSFAQSSIRLDVDAGEASRNILHVKETISASPGEYDLFYPKWIPGEHSPTGPLNNMVNLYVTANGKPLSWRRDKVEMFAFHVTVPQGVKEITISFDDAEQPGSTMTAQLARIKWNRLLLYPRGAVSDSILVTGAIKLPSGWQYATALPVNRETGNTVSFSPVNLTAFVDSPAIIGRYFAKVPLGEANGAPVEMDIAADSADALNYTPETLAAWKNLVRQANLAFGARHYNKYKFLLTLSDNGGDEGLEHHQSSEDGTGEKALTDRLLNLDLADLLGHEYAHSWNGKYRRPASLTTPDFEKPMVGDLLWVYEGLTQYLGHVFPARSGLWTDEVFRDVIAETAASMDHQTGRRWRPLVDTAVAVQFTYSSPNAWRNERRRVDYYDEGSLIWMEADVLIRQRSKGRFSLDDFLRKFHGGQSTGPRLATYDFDEVVRTLNSVVPYDWNTFLLQRVYKVAPRAPLGGITSGGWQLVYNDTPNTQEEIYNRRGGLGLTYSIGMIVNSGGTITDINPDLSAAKAGLAPGMKIVSVNGQSFTTDILRQAVAATRNGPAPIKLDVENANAKETYDINYQGGEKYPHLVRDDSKPDYLSAITKPR